MSADLAAWLDAMVHKEEERRREMTSQHVSPRSCHPASSEAGSRRSSEGSPQEPAATDQPGTEGAQSAGQAAPSTVMHAPVNEQRGNAEKASSSAPQGGLPASVLARLPRTQGRQESWQGPARVVYQGFQREDRRSTSLESETLSERFSSFGSDALLDRYSSISSVDSQPDLPARGSQVLRRSLLAFI